MLAVAKEYRKRAIGSTLVQMAIRAMKEQNADEVRISYREEKIYATHTKISLTHLSCRE